MSTTKVLIANSVRSHSSRVFVWVGTIGVVFILGCGDSGPSRPMAPVAGKVTYLGKSLDHGQVVLIHDSGQIGSSEIRADGSYELEAQVGPNRVMVTCTDYPEYAKAHPEDPDRLRVEKSLIPAKYTNYNTSGLTVDVVEGQNQKTLVLSD